eukprot:gnl/MRDRNA2_/MRDRNA2_110057_c0_seq1.p1 gnl/MRDRNA2_/MRDRNA2_110057_c0~~gnl/MRDRNA2_/MRDRNA2_110057_c0_seq1.p1  ORF type:complete len:1121 (+),score=214.99 gnl/MRDRNA2_/MRDRNA2_110057_c0_seq1:84-3365(+)
MINAWRKEVKAELGWDERVGKSSKSGDSGLLQDVAKLLGFCLSRIMQASKSFRQSNSETASTSRVVEISQIRRPSIQKEDHAARKGYPTDEDMRADLDNFLNQLSSFTKDDSKSQKTHIKEEIHANLLAQRTLRGALHLKCNATARRVYDIMSFNQIAIGQGTFELMVQVAVYSGDVQVARNFIEKMKDVGHKVTQSLMILVEDHTQQNENESDVDGSQEGSSKADATNEQHECLIPDPAEVPRTALAFGMEVPQPVPAFGTEVPETVIAVGMEAPCTNLAADCIPPETTPEMPCPSLGARFKSFQYRGAEIAEPGKHHFYGQITVVDFLHPTEDFDGQNWFSTTLLDRQPIGWDIEWRPDHEEGSDNPVALMQFASENSCILLRMHRLQGWLPLVVRQLLCSEAVLKISYAYDSVDRQKMINSFGFQPAGVLDIMQVSYDRGLVFRGLRGLAEHFHLCMKKDARITCTDWACPGELSKEQVQYAAEDAYFALLIYKELRGPGNTQMTDKPYSINLATQQIADNMKPYTNMTSQPSKSEPVIRNMSHFVHSMNPVMPMQPMFPYATSMFPYHPQMYPYMPCVPFVGNATSEAYGQWQNSGDPFEQNKPKLLKRNSGTKDGKKVADPFEAQDPWKAGASNRSELAKTAQLNKAGVTKAYTHAAAIEETTVAPSVDGKAKPGVMRALKARLEYMEKGKITLQDALHSHPVEHATRNEMMDGHDVLEINDPWQGGSTHAPNQTSIKGEKKSTKRAKPGPDGHEPQETWNLQSGWSAKISDSHKDHCPEPYMRTFAGDQLALELYSCEMDDESCKRVFTPQLLKKLQSKLDKVQPDVDAHYITLDLSNNFIGAEGAKAIVDFLLKSYETGKPVCVRILKLFKNQLGDEGMWHLAQLVLMQPVPIHEAHLSHNGITPQGAATLVLAMGLHPSNAYPIQFQKRQGEHYAACWCRMERNNIQDPAKLVTALQSIGGMRVLETKRPDKEWGPLRSPSWCENLEDAPHAVLHQFSDQGGKSASRPEESLETMVARVEKDLRSLVSSLEHRISEFHFEHQPSPPSTWSTTARPKTWNSSTTSAESKTGKWTAQPTYSKWIPKV